MASDDEWKTDDEDMDAETFVDTEAGCSDKDESEDTDNASDNDKEVGGSNVKSVEDLQTEGLVIFDADGETKLDSKDAKIKYLGVVYAPDTREKFSVQQMILDTTTCISDFAVIQHGKRMFRALPVAREEKTGNIDFHLLTADTEEKKIVQECKQTGVKPAWTRWLGIAKKENGPSTASDKELFGDESGCILMSTDLVQKRQPIKKQPTKSSAPPKKRIKPTSVPADKPTKTKEGDKHEGNAGEDLDKAEQPGRVSAKRKATTPDNTECKRAKGVTVTLTFDSLEDMRVSLFK